MTDMAQWSSHAPRADRSTEGQQEQHDHHEEQQQQNRLSDSDWLIISLSGLVCVVALYTLALLVKNIYSAKRSRQVRAPGGGRGGLEKHCDGGQARKGSPSSRHWPAGGDQPGRVPQSYGTNQLGQHPVIFGKSKDSILVPEFYANLTQQGAEKHARELDPPPGELASALSITRVLTDEKGHSIKIRIASPPPRRQRQLARQYRLTDLAGQLAADPSVAKPSHRDSMDSQSPLVGAEQAPATGPGGGRGLLPSWTDSDAGAGLERAPVHQLWAQDARAKGVRPIDPFNDSNTSEFDDAGSDSRRETSLDFQAAAGEPSAPDAAANEQVMDADLRQASRSNLELLLQQAGQQPTSQAKLVRHASRQSSGGSSGGRRVRAPARSKSLTGAAIGAGFPQSGVLTAASGSTRPAVRAGQQAWPEVFNSDSRRSSSAASTSGAPFGPAPSLRLSVEPVPRREQADESGAPTSGRTARLSLLSNTLAALGRSRSSLGSAEMQVASLGAPSQQPGDEQVFTLRLLEVRNAWLANQAAADQQQAGARRHSLDALYARVFKHQHQDSPAAECQASDTMSVRSTSSQVAECAQLPLVKLTRADSSASADGQASAGCQLAKTPGYTLTCRESDFPIRISLYLAARRSGARHTLGHCFVSLDDLASCALEQALDSADSRRNSLATSTSSSGVNSPRCRLVSVSGGAGFSSEQVRPGEQLLEYKLHQTILEAIKQ